MAYKSIILILETDDSSERLIQQAMRLAAAWKAHVTGHHPAFLPLSYAMMDSLPDAGFVEAATERWEQTDRAMAHKFQTAAQSAGVAAEWLRDTSVNEAGALGVARSADLVVVGRQRSGGGSDLVNTLVHDCGRPVLVLPDSGDPGGEFRRVAVGWNGSRQAARAVFDSLPLLKQAETVELLIVNSDAAEGQPDKEGQAIQATLLRHGVKVALTMLSGDGRTEDQILRHANDKKTDLLVLGAYRGSWLRDVLCGGITEGVLDKTRIATFLSH